MLSHGTLGNGPFLCVENVACDLFPVLPVHFSSIFFGFCFFPILEKSSKVEINIRPGSLNFWAVRRAQIYWTGKYEKFCTALDLSTDWCPQKKKLTRVIRFHFCGQGNKNRFRLCGLEAVKTRRGDIGCKFTVGAQRFQPKHYKYPRRP